MSKKVEISMKKFIIIISILFIIILSACETNNSLVLEDDSSNIFEEDYSHSENSNNNESIDNTNPKQEDINNNISEEDQIIIRYKISTLTYTYYAPNNTYTLDYLSFIYVNDITNNTTSTPINIIRNPHNVENSISSTIHPYNDYFTCINDNVSASILITITNSATNSTYEETININLNILNSSTNTEISLNKNNQEFGTLNLTLDLIKQDN